jgi:type I site-specific restriction endonuclease
MMTDVHRVAYVIVQSRVLGLFPLKLAIKGAGHRRDQLLMPDLTEARTRASLINPQLEKAGWNLSDRSQIQFEVPVQGYDPTPWNGFTDFSLYHPDGTVLAVIEAKRTARNAREGEEQLRQYVKEISAAQKLSPFGFMTNGLHHFFWEVGLAHPRSIAGFFTLDDLLRLQFIHEHKTLLKDTLINKDICERAYQLEAIRRVAEAFGAGKTRAPGHGDRHRKDPNHNGSYRCSFAKFMGTEGAIPR